MNEPDGTVYIETEGERESTERISGVVSEVSDYGKGN